MIRSLLFAAVVGTLTLAPQLASADDKMMKAAPGTVIMSCHTPKTGEKANTQMMADKSTWMCSPVDTKKVMTGPDMTNIKTMDEANKAWKAYLQAIMGPNPGTG
jgi:hypothetical protein